MGLSSSKCAARQSCQESERPNSKTSELCIIGSTSSEGSNIEQVSTSEQCSSSCNGSAREVLPESQQQIKQEALGSTEIRERRVHQPPRILSRTRQGYMDPLTRLRHSEIVNEGNPRIVCRTMQINTDSLTRFPLRQSEAGHGQNSVEEIQARLRSYTGSSSSYMDTAPRTRQQIPDSTSEARMNDLTGVDITGRNFSTSVLSSRRGTTEIASADEIDRYSIRDTAASTQYARRSTSGPSHYADFRNSPTLRAEATGRESRRNGGRRFWDVLTRAASQRRLSNYQETQQAAGRVLVPCNSRSAVMNRRVDTTALSNEERGRNVFRNRNLNLDERRRRFRSQVWALQRLSTSLESVPGHPRPCVRRVHHEPVEESYAASQSTEETDTRASISRIIMLAEALFQVLDEIHRQSIALSQSTGLSLGALRAPDAVVNSMPLKIFQKVDNVENKEEAALQCQICLLEYEGGDHLRVLPCRHEYHMSCIDKWLREVHRICPLCRGDVCELTAKVREQLPADSEEALAL